MFNSGFLLLYAFFDVPLLFMTLTAEDTGRTTRGIGYVFII